MNPAVLLASAVSALLAQAGAAEPRNAPAAAHQSAPLVPSAFDWLCEIEGVYGPDGQPTFVDWHVDLAARKACSGPRCEIEAVVNEATPERFRWTFSGGTFTLDRSNRTYIWSTPTPTQSLHRGTCHQPPSSKGH